MLLYTIDLCVRFKSFIIESTTKLEYNVIIIITVPFELYRNVRLQLKLILTSPYVSEQFLWDVIMSTVN